MYFFFRSKYTKRACLVIVGSSSHSPIWNFFWGGGRLFCKFWRYNTLDIPIFKSTYNVYNYIFLLSSLTTKTWGICEGASKQFPDPKNFSALHGSEIPGRIIFCSSICIRNRFLIFKFMMILKQNQKASHFYK